MLGEIEGLAHWTRVKVLTVVSVVYASHHNMPKYHPLLPPHNSFKSSQPQLVLYLHTPSAGNTVNFSCVQTLLHGNYVLQVWELYYTYSFWTPAHTGLCRFPEAPPTGSFANNTKSIITNLICNVEIDSNIVEGNGRKLQSELLRWRWWSKWHMAGGRCMGKPRMLELWRLEN